MEKWGPMQTCAKLLGFEALIGYGLEKWPKYRYRIGIEIMNASIQLFKSLYFRSISHLTVPLQGNLSMNWMCRSIKIRIESSKHTHKCPIGGAFLKTIAISNFYSLILPPYEELWYSLIQNFSLHFLSIWSFFGRTLSIARGNRSDGWCPLLLKWAPVGWSSFFCVM